MPNNFTGIWRHVENALINTPGWEMQKVLDYTTIIIILKKSKFLLLNKLGVIL